MALSKDRLRELAAQLAAAMPPARMEVLVTGQAFTSEALDVARAYERANASQKAALLAVARSFDGAWPNTRT